MDIAEIERIQNRLNEDSTHPSQSASADPPPAQRVPHATVAHVAHLLGTDERPKRAAWRETPTGEALAFDRWRLSSALGGIPGETRIVRPGAFGLIFDCPAPCTFLDPETGQPREGALLDGGIAVLSITGPLEHQDSWWWTSYAAILREAELALSWPGVRALVPRYDSPGGVCAGMLAAHRALRALRQKHGKPIVSYVSEMAASAGYGLACASDEIWMPPEAVVGSIGVILCTIDESKHLEKEGIRVRYVVTGARKADLHPGAPVTDDVLQEAQAKVDALGAKFFAAVAQARGMSPEDVEALEAAVFMGETAVDVGLADGVADWEDFLGTLRGTLGGSLAGTSGTVAQQKVETMPTRMQAQKARDEAHAAVGVAQAAVAAAKGAAVASAAKALADALAKADAADAALAAFNPSAKVTHYRRLEEKTVESPEKEEEAAASEEAPPATQPSERAEDSTSDMPASGEGDEEDAKNGKAEEKALAKAYAAGTSALKASGFGALQHYGPRALLSLAEKALGVTGVRAVVGALGALPDRLASADKLTARVATLEKEQKKSRAERTTEQVNALVAEAKRAGKTLSAEHRAKLRAFGSKFGVEELRGHIAMLPKAVRTLEDGGLEAKEGDDGRGQFTQAEDAERSRIIDLVTADMTPAEKADYVKDFEARLAANAPKVPRI